MLLKVPWTNIINFQIHQSIHLGNIKSYTQHYILEVAKDTY